MKTIVIGYGCYGESTLVLLMDGDVVFYTVVIDGYTYKDEKAGQEEGPYINKAALLLKDYGVSTIDVLCWTHPHDDHSKGIPRLIKKNCDGNTKVMFPIYLQDNITDIVKYGEVSKQNINYIYKKNRAHKAKATPVGVAESGEANIDEFFVRDLYSSDVIARVRIDALTPISSELSEYVNDTFCNDPNELSISLVVDISGYCFYFGGDTINAHIKKSKRLILKQCRVVKIPHHSSPTAVDLTNYLPQELDAVCTTVFKKGVTNLPDERVIDRYRKFNTAIFSTNMNRGKEYPYGLIEYDCDCSTGFPKITKVVCEGNGGEI